MVNVLEEKDAIRELIARYCFHIDLGRFDEWLGLFTEDGTFDLGAMGRFTGREALRGFLKNIPMSQGKPSLRHCVLNTIIDLQGDKANSQSYFIIISDQPQIGVSVVGRYDDQLVKSAGAWRFKVRRVDFDMMSHPR